MFWDTRMVTERDRTRKPVVVWVPGELDFGGLPKKMRDPARWFVGQVVSKTACGGVDVDGYARMRGDIVREIVGRAAWPAVLDYFKAAVETSPHIKGVRARGYRLGPEVGGAAVCVRLSHPPLVRRVLRWYEECERDQDARLLPIHRALRDQLAALTVTPEMDDAVAALDKAGARVCMSAAVQRIRHGQSAFSVSKTGRLFTSFCGLKRSLREHVRLAGERVCGIDIETCQPSLLAALPVLLGGMVPYASGIKSANIISPPCGLLCCCLLADRVGLYHPNVVYFFKHLADWAAELGSDFRDYQTVCATSDVYHELVDMALAAGLDIPDDIAPRDWAKRAFLIAVKSLPVPAPPRLGRSLGVLEHPFVRHLGWCSLARHSWRWRFGDVDLGPKSHRVTRAEMPTDCAVHIAGREHGVAVSHVCPQPSLLVVVEGHRPLAIRGGGDQKQKQNKQQGSHGSSPVGFVDIFNVTRFSLVSTVHSTHALPNPAAPCPAPVACVGTSYPRCVAPRKTAGKLGKHPMRRHGHKYSTALYLG
jgi:hypothetical protein